MRTLKEEIAYCRSKGYHYNSVDLSTMLSWLGERVAEDEEREALKSELDAEQRKTAVVYDTNSVWQAIPPRVREWTNVEHVIAVLDAVSKVMKRI